MSDVPEQPETEKVQFDEHLCNAQKELALALFQQFPMLRSIGVTFDYYGALNDAQVQKGVWMSDKGPVSSADAIFGSMFQTLRLLQEQFARAIDYGAHLRESVEVMTIESVRLHNDIQEKTTELQRLEAAIQGKRDDAPDVQRNPG